MTTPKRWSLFSRDTDVVIHRPREVYVDESADGIEGFLVVDRSGGEQIINFRDPLRQPLPETQRTDH